MSKIEDIESLCQKILSGNYSTKHTLQEDGTILIQAIPISAMYKDEEQEEPLPFLTQEEINNNIQIIQNQTHGEVCGTCVKALNNTPNPHANMRYCKYNGTMVSKHQACCEVYKHGK